jgi:hypothetical protein
MKLSKDKTYHFAFREGAGDSEAILSVDVNKSAVDVAVKAAPKAAKPFCRGEMSLDEKTTELQVQPKMGPVPQVAKLQKALKDQQFTGFQGINILKGGPEGEASGARPPAPAAEAPAARGGKVAWMAARVDATNKVRRLQARLAKTKHPEAGATVVLLENVVKRLTADLTTRQSVLEMTRYVSADPDISDLETLNGDGLDCAVRAGLLKGLKVLADQMPA